MFVNSSMFKALTFYHKYYPICQSLSASFSERTNNFAHIMDLYRGLLNHSDSDIVLAIDSADGVKQNIFDEMKNITELAVKCLSHVKQTRIAVISFSDKVKVLHSFKDCQKEKCIVQSLKNLR